MGLCRYFGCSVGDLLEYVLDRCVRPDNPMSVLPVQVRLVKHSKER